MSMFRKVVLDKLASPEQLDMLMVVANPRNWIALAGLLCILIAAVFWSVSAEIPIQIVAPSILVNDGIPEAHLYLSPAASRNLREGMPVVLTTESGPLMTFNGTISAIDKTPASDQQLADVFAGRSNLQAAVVNVETPIEVKVAFAPDVAQGAAEFISGTLANAVVEVGQQRPIEMVVPLR